MGNDELSHRQVEMEWTEALEQEKRFSDIEARIKFLESRLEVVVRKVYDIPDGVTVYTNDIERSLDIIMGNDAKEL